MTSESSLISEENNFLQLPESQTLDSLLQSSCETSNQSDILENRNTCEINNASNDESDQKRTWLEIVDLYVDSLKPKDTVIFIENVKVFSKGTAYMSDFRNLYFDHILKYLNGGEPLKTDFGRDEFTSLYSLYSFSAVNSENKEECLDTPMIFKVMETMDVLNFAERNVMKKSSSMKKLLSDAKNIFSYFNKIRNYHLKRKRYLIFVICSDISIDDINDLVDDLKAMKVRFSLFSPVRNESYTSICELLNYNSKGCKDLSCYYQSAKWPVALTKGLSKAFESNNACQIQNKKVKWNSLKETNDSNEYDFINLMNLGNISNISQIPENIINNVPIDNDNLLNNSLTGRSLTNNDQSEQAFSQANNNINTLSTSQSALSHSKSQPKFLPSSNVQYYPPNSVNQSQMNKVNQMPYCFNQDQLYSAPNSVSVSSHRSTPSSIPHSQSPQFHVGNTHQNFIQQSNSVPEMLKPNSVESCTDHSQINPQLNPMKSVQINQETDMVQSMQRYPFVNNMNKMFSSTSNMNMNTANINPNRFVNRAPMYQTNIDPRNGSSILFEGSLKYTDDLQTDIRILADQSMNLSILSMDSWEHKCSLFYLNYFDTYASILYGKSNSDMDIVTNDNSFKTAIDLQIKIIPQALDTIYNALATKPNQTIGIVCPQRQISSEIHVQVFCFVLNRPTSSLKVLIPADPKNVLDLIRTKVQTFSPASYPGNQTNQMYNSMKRNNIVPNQLYGIQQSMSMPRQMMNRYNSHNSTPISMIGNQVYRNISHSNFINNQQMQTNPNYILHSNQYPSVPNQTSNHMLSVDMGMQSNQNMYDQGSY